MSKQNKKVFGGDNTDKTFKQLKRDSIRVLKDSIRNDKKMRFSFDDLTFESTVLKKKNQIKFIKRARQPSDLDLPIPKKPIPILGKVFENGFIKRVHNLTFGEFRKLVGKGQEEVAKEKNNREVVKLLNANLVRLERKKLEMKDLKAWWVKK